MTQDNTVTLPKDELFEMLDIIDEMVGFCSGQMFTERYNKVANAPWVLAHRAAGNDAIADRLKKKLLENRGTTKLT